ncbi:MAG: PTS sugar transporter subunit IIA [Planctomycetes bacterium]|nr:PTS sugar transporter subunit IIA [Planctomycetota bacterium]
MNVLRYLRPECVRLNLETQATPAAEDESPAQRANRQKSDKERVIEEVAEILDASGRIANRSKFLRDLVQRERNASTALAPGIAIPHVRTLQVREFIMGLARASGDGVPFGSADGEPTRLFFLLAAPPYDDRIYLQVYRELAELIQREEIIDRLLAAREVQDVFNALREVWR